MEEYAQAKENIFSHQGPGDLAIFNQDNDLTVPWRNGHLGG